MLQVLRETLGADVAETLFEHLPPTGWGDVARRPDINHLEARIDRLEARFDQLEARIDEKFNAFEDRLMLRTETMVNKAINRQLWIMLSFTGAMVIAMVSGVLNQ